MTSPSIKPVLLPLVLLASAALAQSEQTYRRAIELQKKQQEQALAQMEALPGPPRPFNRILTLRMDNDRLVARSALFDLAQPNRVGLHRRIDVEGFATPFTFMATTLGAAAPFYVTLTNTSFPNMEGALRLQIMCQPNYLQIIRNWHTRDQNQTLNFTQTYGRGKFGQADGVQLTVYMGDNLGNAQVNVALAESDFLTLRRKHPQIVNQHLRPLFHQLMLDHLFSVEPLTAWQIFADRWPGDPELARRIRAMLPALDADTYAQREQATEELKKLGPMAALSIYLMPRAGLSIEQNSRLDAVVASYPLVSRDEAQRLREDPQFLLDCLHCDDATVRRLALEQLRKVRGQAIDLDVDAPADARNAAVEVLRRSLTAQ